MGGRFVLQKLLNHKLEWNLANCSRRRSGCQTERPTQTEHQTRANVATAIRRPYANLTRRPTAPKQKKTSFPRKRESICFRLNKTRSKWIPASAGMTTRRRFRRLDRSIAAEIAGCATKRARRNCDPLESISDPTGSFSVVRTNQPKRLELQDDALHGFVRTDVGRVDAHFRVFGDLVRIADAGEFLELAGAGQRV